MEHFQSWMAVCFNPDQTFSMSEISFLMSEILKAHRFKK